MNKKTTFTAAGIIILVLLVWGGISLFGSKSINPDDVVIGEISVDNSNVVVVKGTLTGSASGFKSYKTSKKDDKVYITLLSSGILSASNDGDFNIQLKNLSGSISEVFLKDGTNTKKIWSKN